jgi:hypothetical protein
MKREEGKELWKGRREESYEEEGMKRAKKRERGRQLRRGIREGYYSISLRSLYLWCDMSTNFIFKTSYLPVLP